MTLRIEDPIREGGVRRIVMPIPEVTVAEIAFEGGRYVMHFHPLAAKLSGDSHAELEREGRAEVKRLNALHAVTQRLTK